MTISHWREAFPSACPIYNDVAAYSSHSLFISLSLSRSFFLFHSPSRLSAAVKENITKTDTSDIMHETVTETVTTTHAASVLVSVTVSVFVSVSRFRIHGDMTSAKFLMDWISLN